MAVSCTRGVVEPLHEPGTGSTAISLLVSPSPEARTKSQFAEETLTAIKDVWVMAVYKDDFWLSRYYTGQALTRDGFSVICPAMVLRAGIPITLYVTANMGDLTETVRTILPPNGIPDMAVLEYMLPDQSVSAIPMAVKTTLTTDAEDRSLPLSLEPLLGRLDITIDKSGITGQTASEVLASGALRVKNANRRLRPFGASAAKIPSDLFTIDMDSASFSASDKYDMTHTHIVLYVPENVQGDLLAEGSSQWDKGNLPAEGKNLCSYLEYSCSKDSGGDGVYGDISYRAYLGEDATHNYSVLRNSTYHCTLNLTWNGLFYDGDWRIDNSALSDDRVLALSSSPNTILPSYSNMGRIRRRKASAIYVHFSRDGGTTWVSAAKDVDSWPYGWDLYIDGILQPAGLSGTASGDIGWAYSSEASGELLEIIPGPSAVLKSEHTVQLVTADGQRASNSVRFQIEQPFTSRWTSDAVPCFVAQRGLLQCIDPDTDAPSPEGVFHSDQPDKIRISDNGDGTAYISLLAPFEADSTAVYLTDADGERRCNVSLESLLPYFACSDLRTCYLDESANIRFAYYQDEQGEQPLRLSPTSAEPACGTLLDAELAAECIAPQVVSALGKLGFERTLAQDGSFFMKTYVRTYKGLSPTGTSFEVDQALLSMSGYPSRGQHSTVFVAFNPWAQINGIGTGSLMNDYTLYCEPNWNMPYTGWQAYLSDAPEESTNYTKLISPAVVADVQHLSLAARFHESGQSIGINCSGLPLRVSPDCQPIRWSLQVSVNPSLSATSQDKLLQYFSKKGISFINTDDMMDALAQQGYSFVIGGAYESQSAANRAKPAGTISGCTFSSYWNTDRYNWTLTYGMKGIQKTYISKHAAGRILVYLRLCNPYDHSILEKPVMETWMKLHLYLWPRAEGPLSGGTRFQAELRFPSNLVDGLPDFFRRGSGVLDIAASLSAAGGIATLVNGAESAAQMGSAATWQWEGGRSIENLGWGLSNCSPAPFTWKRASELQYAAPDCFERISDYVVQFDPSGSARTYSYSSDKLFVFYLYNGSEPLHRPAFYVSP